MKNLLKWGFTNQIVRMIEDLIGKMKTGTVKYRNIFTGQELKITDFLQIEVETIDYLVSYFSNNLETEVQGLKDAISKDIKILRYKTDRLKKTKDTFNKSLMIKQIITKPVMFHLFLMGCQNEKKIMPGKKVICLIVVKIVEKQFQKSQKKYIELLMLFHSSERTNILPRFLL